MHVFMSSLLCSLFVITCSFVCI